MVVRGNNSTVGWLKWVLGGMAVLLFSILMFLIQGTASRLSSTQDRLVTHGERLTKAEADLNNINARLTLLESRVERRLNPRPWEMQGPTAPSGRR